ncbi:MAG: GIY-YIG nuclease family protein [bacterium]|nr:GIY-YIG nuclease family protein [bacterium]
MGDYNLEGLNARSFEQLVQTIGLCEFGAGAQAFGDGPDGGRDLLFRGTLELGGTRVELENAIVQVKYRQVLGAGSRASRDWLLDRLDQELKKLRRTELHPDYYIVATNVRLSGRRRTGGVDRVTAKLKEAHDDGVLADFAIWDGNQIERLIDKHREHLAPYLPYVSMGDYIGTLLAALETGGGGIDSGLDTRELDSVLVGYLHDGYRRNKDARLRQAGDVGSDKVKLSELFFDLPAIRQPSSGAGPNRTDHFVAYLRERLVGPANPPTRILLLGGLGQGKTTLLSFLGQAFRAVLLSSSSSNAGLAHLAELNEELDIFLGAGHEDNGLSDDAALAPTSVRLPLIVDLPKLADELASQTKSAPGSIAEFVRSELNRGSTSQVSEPDLQRILELWPTLVICDGLDEVVNPQLREQVLGYIARLDVEAAARRLDLAMVVASRRESSVEESLGGRFERWEIQHFSESTAVDYGRHLARLRYRHNEERQRTVAKRLEDAAKRESAAHLLRTPLQIAILTFIVDREGEPPTDRWTLYHDYYDTVVKRELERGGKDIINRHRSLLDAIQAHVAVVIHERLEQRDIAHAPISTELLSLIVTRHLEAEGYEEDLNQRADQLVDVLLLRLMFLQKDEADRTVDFELATFRHYFAVERLLEEHNVDDAEYRLAAIAGHRHWDGVFLTAACKAFKNKREHASEAVVNACKALNDSEVPPYVRSGSLLALRVLREAQAIISPKYARPLAELGLAVLERPDQFFLADLVASYNVELRAVYAPKLDATRLSRLTGYIANNHWDLLAQLARLDPEMLTHTGAQSIETVLRGCSPSTVVELAKDNHDLSAPARAELLKRGPAKLTEPDFEDLDAIVEPPAAIEVARGVVNLDLASNSMLVRVHDDEASEVLHIGTTRLEGRDHKSPYTAVLTQSGPATAGWNVYALVAAFMDQPDKRTLGALVTQLEDTDTAEVAHLANKAHLPWPLAFFIQWARDGQIPPGLGQEVSKGNLGDRSEWTKLERRWTTSGIEIGELVYSDPPPTLDLLRRGGFPLASTSHAETVDGVLNLELAAQALQSRDSRPNHPSRAKLATLLAESTDQLAHPDALPSVVYDLTDLGETRAAANLLSVAVVNGSLAEASQSLLDIGPAEAYRLSSTGDWIGQIRGTPPERIAAVRPETLQHPLRLLKHASSRTTLEDDHAPLEEAASWADGRIGWDVLAAAGSIARGEELGGDDLLSLVSQARAHGEGHANDALRSALMDRAADGHSTSLTHLNNCAQHPDMPPDSRQRWHEVVRTTRARLPSGLADLDNWDRLHLSEPVETERLFD